MLIKYVLRNYTARNIITLIFEEYVWSILKHVPGIEGILLRRLYIRIFAGKAGKGSVIQRGVHIRDVGKLEIGDNLFINRCCHLDCYGGLKIGNNVGIGPHTIIITANHGFLTRGTNYANHNFVGQRVEIGDGSIVSANCYINPGIRIGSNCIVAAGTSVFCNVPDGKKVGPAAMTSYASAMRCLLKEFGR